MSDPTDPKFWEDFWGWLIVGPVGAGLALWLKRAKAFGSPDYEAIAKAVAKEVVREMLSEARAENDQHREGIERSIDRLSEEVARLVVEVRQLVHEVRESVQAVRDANEATRNRVADLVMSVARR